ncbi:hypothetical protein TSAR_014059 [Trichomalopsis sarcophagae]|uniref:Uncharacterized protein n=1 Tax=Trichomalopsis sarcophagae TaxID=543379 RepID=A0A232FLY3_9HYME|nr:hypothetical protein TSAR_014059 [Trichomalopsis sarcophagae]
MTGLKSGILVLLAVLAARDAQGAKLSVDAKMREDTDLSQIKSLKHNLKSSTQAQGVKAAAVVVSPRDDDATDSTSETWLEGTEEARFEFPLQYIRKKR